MFRLSLLCLTFLSLTIANKNNSFDAPFIINKEGLMELNINGHNYTLNDNLTLKVIDEVCETKIDFSRANETEKNDKKGIRIMTVACERDTDEDDDSTGSEEVTTTPAKKK
ncbi:unnamed protein product [Schistosoma turkestanicum]|nr:unnamed protein product [Schistosoma turkestanicum]